MGDEMVVYLIKQNKVRGFAINLDFEFWYGDVSKAVWKLEVDVGILKSELKSQSRKRQIKTRRLSMISFVVPTK